jgi:hypothetical protein
MMNKLLIIALIAGMLLGAVAAASLAEAKPFFTKKTNAKIIGVIKSDPNCPPEFYARATPKNNNHVLLNKEDIKNTDGSTMHKFSWYYDPNKMKATSDTNEGKIRTYVVGVDINDVQTGQVVTHYVKVQVGKKTVDFGTFDMRGTSVC